MSLQVWLPLNGDLHNQGLNNIQFTNNGATIDNSGKIGKCYLFNGSSNFLKATHNFYSNKYSVCAWVYSTSSTATQTICCDRTAVGSGFSIFLTSGKIRIDSGGNNLQWATGYTYPVNTWFHLAITYDGTNTSYYINGEFKAKQAQTISSSYWGNTTSIGASQSNNSSYGNYLNGKLNDIRIYDHCLSQKEIEEISKGLVLHYKLDDCISNVTINPNLLPDTNVSSLTKVKGAYARYYESASSGTYTKAFEAISDPPIPGIKYGVHYNVTAASGFHGVTWYQNGLVNVTAGQEYTLSCYAKKISTGNVTLKFQYGKNPYVAGTIQMINDNNWHQYSWTFTPNTASGGAAASGTTRIYGAGPSTVGEVIICGWKLEEGNIATPWCEVGDTFEDLSTNIVFDSSGYNHNGTIVGSLETTTPSPKYNYATLFNGSSIVAIGTQLYDMKDEMTVNLWVNKTWNSNTGTPFSSVQGGGFGWQVSNANYTFYCGTGATSNTYISKAITTSSLSAGWHMLSATYDGLALRLYIDGKISSTTSKYTTKTPLYYNSASGMFVGGESAGAVNTTATDRFNGQISDVRIYATALTDIQIKELYDISATIDNRGNIYAREYLENNNLSINKQGQFQENILVDDNDLTQASILKTNKQIQGFTVYEY